MKIPIFRKIMKSIFHAKVFACSQNLSKGAKALAWHFVAQHAPKVLWNFKVLKYPCRSFSVFWLRKRLFLFTLFLKEMWTGTYHLSVCQKFPVDLLCIANHRSFELRDRRNAMLASHRSRRDCRDAMLASHRSRRDCRFASRNRDAKPRREASRLYIKSGML